MKNPTLIGKRVYFYIEFFIFKMILSLSFGQALGGGTLPLSSIIHKKFQPANCKKK